MPHRHPIALLTTALTVVLTTLAPPAQGFHQTISTMPLGRIHYSIDESYWNAGYLTEPLWAAEQGWKIQDLWRNAEFWNDTWGPGALNRRVYAGFIDGPGNTDAEATVGCVTTCRMTFEPGSATWNTTTAIRDHTWLDFVGVATHEFGHWHGLHHVSLQNHAPENLGGTTNGRYPDSDNGTTPTMEGPRLVWDARHFRTIQADDVNGFRSARHTTPGDLAANGSFDYASPDWGGSHGMGWRYRRSGAGGSSARYCSGAVHGPCFIEFNGGGTKQSSIYQDIFSWNNNWIAGRSMTPRMRLRSPVFASSVTVVVWAMEPTPTIAYTRTCPLSAGVWIELSATTNGCFGQVAFNEPMTSVWMRLEIYNEHTNHNLDVDNVRLEF